MLVNCYSCKGKKNVVGLGLINSKCTICDGVGYINKTDNADSIYTASTASTSKHHHKSKRGKKDDKGLSSL